MTGDPAAFYRAALARVTAAGYAAEVEWARSVRFADATEARFLQETGFVILNSGMRAKVIDAHWPRIRLCFHGLTSASDVALTADTCVELAKRSFKHEGKLRAIVAACELVVGAGGWAPYRELVAADPIGTLRQIPFIGPITVYHLARNLGLDHAKPDRHLVRLAAAHGFDDVQRFCQTIADAVGERVGAVDAVLWRDAVLTAAVRSTP